MKSPCPRNLRVVTIRPSSYKGWYSIDDPLFYMGWLIYNCVSHDLDSGNQIHSSISISVTRVLLPVMASLVHICTQLEACRSSLVGVLAPIQFLDSSAVINVIVFTFSATENTGAAFIDVVGFRTPAADQMEEAVHRSPRDTTPSFIPGALPPFLSHGRGVGESLGDHSAFG